MNRIRSMLTRWIERVSTDLRSTTRIDDPTPVDCPLGDDHDHAFIDLEGKCPGLLPETDDPHDEMIDETTVRKWQVNLLAADAAHAQYRVRRWQVYGPCVEAPDREDFAAIARWNQHLETERAAQALIPQTCSLNIDRDRPRKET